MPFTNPNFPNQIFSSMDEFYEAQLRRQKVEEEIKSRSEEVTKVTATIVPTPQNILEKR